MEEIHLIAPGKYCGQEVIKNGIDLLTSFGFTLKVGQYAGHHQGYFSGNDHQRAADFKEAIQQEEVTVFFARGGYGAIKVLELLDENLLEKNRPIVYGYSDATVFHLKMSQLSLPSVHAPMALDFPKLTESSKYQLKQALLKKELHYNWQGHPLNKKGQITAKITGGNLAVIASMMGSKHLPDFNGKILFIEDVGEALYAIDRLLMMLELNGVLSKISALMVGQFTAIGDSDPPYEKKVEDIILSYLEKYNIPVCFNLPVGHIANNQSIYFGVESSLLIEKDKTVLVQKFHNK